MNSSRQIPKIFHRIWLGDQRMPAWAERYGEGWQQTHPGWEMKLWTDSNLPSLVNQDYFDAAVNMGHKSDILRLELIRLFGGVYLDIDMECQRNIEPLLQDAAAFIAYTEPDDDFFFLTCFEQAIMGAVPGHHLFARAVFELGDWVEQHRNDGPLVQVAAWYLANKIREVYGWQVCQIPAGVMESFFWDDLKIFPKRFFYPYSFRDMWRSQYEYPEAYAVHRVMGTWHS